MNHRTIGRAIVCLVLAAAVLATIVAFVPPPVQFLALLIALPIESLLVAVATAPGRRPVAHKASHVN